MVKVGVSQIGARRGYAVPRALESQGCLEVLHTDLHAGDALSRLLLSGLAWPGGPRRLQRLASRRIPGIPPRRIRTHRLFSLRGWAGLLRNPAPRGRYERWIRANRRFGSSVVRAGMHGADAAYCFNGAALEIFEHARARGLGRILDQTSASVDVEEALLAEERARWPGWEADPAASDGPRRMMERERAEWRLAQVVVCGSDWVRDSLVRSGVPAERCVVVPYGLPVGRPLPREPRGDRSPLRVLFAGNACLRKGAPYLVEAARALQDAEAEVVFRQVGHMGLTAHGRTALEACVQVDGPVPRSEMPGVYAQADVLLLPTISEGSAGVTYEALAHGVPVVTTAHAGSVVRDGVDGFLVPIRSSEAVVEVLRRLAGDRSLLREMSEHAARRAEAFTLERYGARLVEAMTHHLPAAG